MPLVMEGVIVRRVPVNYWAEPAVVCPLVPQCFELSLRNGLAVVGICLIRLESLRPKGLPASFGISMENMAHRVAVRFWQNGATRDAVYILDRATNSSFVARLGGRFFPGVHHKACFTVRDQENSIALDVTTRAREMDVIARVRPAVEWKASRLFHGLCDVSSFYRAANCGYSCALTPGTLEGVELRTRHWTMLPLAIRGVQSAFFDNPYLFPPGSIGLDSAVLMRGIPHEWHALPEIGEEQAARRSAIFAGAEIPGYVSQQFESSPAEHEHENELVSH